MAFFEAKFALFQANFCAWSGSTFAQYSCVTRNKFCAYLRTIICEICWVETTTRFSHLKMNEIPRALPSTEEIWPRTTWSTAQSTIASSPGWTPSTPPTSTQSMSSSYQSLTSRSSGSSQFPQRSTHRPFQPRQIQPEHQGEGHPGHLEEHLMWTRLTTRSSSSTCMTKSLVNWVKIIMEPLRES